MPPNSNRNANNWFIHALFINQKHDECLSLIDRQLKTNAFQEFPLYVKALIFRQRGLIQPSLILFQSATCLNPSSKNLKQVAYSLFLLGKHKQALEVFEEAQKVISEVPGSTEDRDILHNRGLCYVSLKDYQSAIFMFQKAIAIQANVESYVQLGKIFERTGSLSKASEAFGAALTMAPKDPSLLALCGQFSQRRGDQAFALRSFTSSIQIEPSVQAIAGWSSSSLEQREIDEAISKYRLSPSFPPQLWSNLSFVFFSKGQHLPATSCLLRAHYHAPLEWIINYNLGLLCLSTRRDSTAAHYLRTASSLNPDYPETFMLLGIALSRLGDTVMSHAAFEKALNLDSHHHASQLNFAISLYNHGFKNDARSRLEQFRQSRIAMKNSKKNELDPEATSISAALEIALEGESGRR